MYMYDGAAIFSRIGMTHIRMHIHASHAMYLHCAYHRLKFA